MNKNKGTILTSIATLAIIVFPILCTRFTKALSPLTVMLIVVAVESLVLAPMFCINYFKMYRKPLANKTFLAFIPHVNYIILFSRNVYQVVSSIILGILVLLVLMLNSSWWMSFAPETLVLRYDEKMATIILVVVVLYCVSIGLGLFGVMVDIKNIYNKNFPASASLGVSKVLDTFNFLQLLILIIPIVRCLGLILGIDKMNTIVLSGGDAFTSVDGDEFEEV